MRDTARSLHDGVQQRLASIAFELRAVEGAAPDHAVKVRLLHAADDLAGAIDELVGISQGIHPAVSPKAASRLLSHD